MNETKIVDILECDPRSDFQIPGVTLLYSRDIRSLYESTRAKYDAVIGFSPHRHFLDGLQFPVRQEKIAGGASTLYRWDDLTKLDQIVKNIETQVAIRPRVTCLFIDLATFEERYYEREKQARLVVNKWHQNKALRYLTKNARALFAHVIFVTHLPLSPPPNLRHNLDQIVICDDVNMDVLDAEFPERKSVIQACFQVAAAVCIGSDQVLAAFQRK